MHTCKLVRMGSLVMALAATCVAGTAAAAQGVGPPPQGEPGTPLDSATGTVRRLLRGPGGEIDGLLLDDGTIVDLPAHMGESLRQLVPEGSRIEAHGKQQKDATGGNVIVAQVLVVTPENETSPAQSPRHHPAPTPEIENENGPPMSPRHTVPPLGRPNRDVAPPLPPIHDVAPPRVPDEVPPPDTEPFDESPLPIP